jgi:rhodanese-related sulfurtransferase
VSTGVEGLLGAARARITRWSPAQAFLLVREGALLVDIRPESQRRTHGEVPYGLVIERNVLEWRLDPTSPWRIPQADSHDRTVVVLCQEGYASSFAAAALIDLGYRRAGDVDGGFAAWRDAKLPVTEGRLVQKRLAPTEAAPRA